MFGFVRKKKVIKELEFIEKHIKGWEDIWNDSKDESVRITVTHTLRTINELVRDIKQYFKGV